MHLIFIPYLSIFSAFTDTTLCLRSALSDTLRWNENSVGVKVLIKINLTFYSFETFLKKCMINNGQLCSMVHAPLLKLKQYCNVFNKLEVDNRRMGEIEWDDRGKGRAHGRNKTWRLFSRKVHILRVMKGSILNHYRDSLMWPSTFDA